MRTFCLMLLAAGLIAAPARTTAAEDPICTDRPTKSTGTCTAEEGHPQVEAELVNFSESTTDGVRTRTWVGLNPTVKVGIGPTLDAELNLPTWIDTRVHDASGATTSAHGVGDLTARVKWKLHADPRLEVALMPSIKVPSAGRAVGNGQWEGGLMLPVVVDLDEEWVLNLSPEFDSIANASGRGHHFATAQLINLSRSLPHDITLSAELWAAWDADPDGHHRQRSFDAGIAWLVTRSLQLDTGVNLGLDRETPPLQAYAGVSRRF